MSHTETPEFPGFKEEADRLVANMNDYADVLVAAKSRPLDLLSPDSVKSIDRKLIYKYTSDSKTIDTVLMWYDYGQITREQLYDQVGIETLNRIVSYATEQIYLDLLHKKYTE